jgi:hypothetical protein
VFLASAFLASVILASAFPAMTTPGGRLLFLARRLRQLAPEPQSLQLKINTAERMRLAVYFGKRSFGKALSTDCDGAGISHVARKTKPPPSPNKINKRKNTVNRRIEFP